MSEKTINKVPNVPNLRFFNDNSTWSNSTLEKMCKFVGGGTPSTMNQDYWNGDIAWISSADLLEENVHKYNVSRFITEDAVMNSATKICPINTIMIVSRVGVGKIAISNSKICTSQDFINLTEYQFDKDFLVYSLKNTIEKLKISSQGTSIKGITSKEIKLINIFYPEIIEQHKIGLFFKKIDERISLQNKIIDNLLSLMNGIRNIIFSGDNNCFTNTTNNKLGYFLEEYSKKNIENNLQSASIGKYGIRMRDEIYSKELTNDYSKNKVIFKDTLSIGMGSTQIDIGILSENKEYCISPAYTTYKIKNINSQYLNEYLIYLNPLLSKRYMIIGARQGKSVNKHELLEHEILIHSNEEQSKIVKIFNLLYAKLKKEKDILSLYKKQKAYLLQNMFI